MVSRSGDLGGTPEITSLPGQFAEVEFPQSPAACAAADYPASLARSGSFTTVRMTSMPIAGVWTSIETIR